MYLEIAPSTPQFTVLARSLHHWQSDKLLYLAQMESILHC